jgi:hypothetical protein
MPATTKPKPSWRDVLKIHSAAELFPRMSPDELRALGEDIVKNGLTSPIVLWRVDAKAPVQLLDGRNRLDAIEIVTASEIVIGPPSLTAGEDFLAVDKVIMLEKSVDPYAYVISANINRRHLTAEQKRELIGKLLKDDPTKSNRQIAKMVGASHPHVAKVREQAEKAGDVEMVTTSVDTKGRQQQVHKPRKPRNPAREKLHREMKLSPDVVEKIKGTSLDSAREQDALIRLDRGASEGGHTEDVKKLVEAAVAGKPVSAVALWKKAGPLPPLDDVGPDSPGELERLRARNEELENRVRRLEIENAALRSEVDELRAQLPPDNPGPVPACLRRSP